MKIIKQSYSVCYVRIVSKFDLELTNSKMDYYGADFFSLLYNAYL